MIDKPRILLVGGNGFLGTHLAQSLLNRWDVRIFDRPRNLLVAADNVRTGVVGSGSEMDAAMDGCEAIIYLIHETGSSPYLDSERQSLTRNMDLFLTTMASAEKCGVKKIALYSSGGAVYGIPQKLPVCENHPIRPISAYGVAKASMELYLHSAAHSKGIQYLILRPSNPYGPGQHPLRKQGVIPIFINKILKGEPLEIWGNGNLCKDYIFVKDLTMITAALLSMEWENKAYNIGSGHGTSLLTIIQTIEQITQKAAITNFMPPRSTDVPEIVLDTSRVSQRTGICPCTSLADGIGATVEWLKPLLNDRPG